MGGIAHGEGVGQRIVEPQVAALHVRHAGGGLRRQPLIPLAAVEHLVGPVPAVVEILDEGQRQVADIRPERRHDRGALRLAPDRLAAGEDHRMRITEPAIWRNLRPGQAPLLGGLRESLVGAGEVIG
jgi:hypothetical protein